MTAELKLHQEADGHNVRLEGGKSHVKIWSVMVTGFEAEFRRVGMEIAIGDTEGHPVVQVKADSGLGLPREYKIALGTMQAEGTTGNRLIIVVSVEECDRAANAAADIRNDDGLWDGILQDDIGEDGRGAKG